MSKPVVVSIPHRHGKEEAIRRLKTGLASARQNYSHLIAVQDETWVGDQLQFRVSALGQQAAGDIVVADDHVVLTVTLPWLLSKFAHAVQGAVKKQGTLMLEKK
ncbi:MAG: polyhydroxyalkanoic acid system family protein [Pseudorhodoplanes sp.]